MRLRSGRTLSLVQRERRKKAGRKYGLKRAQSVHLDWKVVKYQQISHLEQYPSGMSLIAKGEGPSCKRVVATILWQRHEADLFQHRAWISNIEVASGWQRMYLATYLLYCCLQRLKQLSITEVELIDRTEDEIGTFLYKGNGFKVEKGFRRQHVSGVVDFLLSNLKEKVVKHQLPDFTKVDKNGPCIWLLHTLCE